MSTTETIIEKKHEATVGNYLDCIHNIVYSVQKYFDEFYHYIPELYKVVSSCGKCSELASFMLSENENIIKQKCIKFSIDANTLIIRKYEEIVKNINKAPEDARYYKYKDVFLFFNDHQEYIDWSSLKGRVYRKKSKSEMLNMYHFDTYLDDDLNHYKEYQFIYEKEFITPSEMHTIVDVSFLKLSTTFVRLKELMETSNSMYNSAMIVRAYIDMLCIVYIAISFVKEVE